MTNYFKLLGLASLCAAVLLAYVADAQAQDKGAPEKAAPQKGGKMLPVLAYKIDSTR